MLMPEYVYQLLTLFAAAFGVASFIGYGWNKGKITSLRDDLKDAREGRSADKAEITQLRADLTLAQSDLKSVVRTVTGEAHWVAIGDQLDTHHREATGYWSRAEVNTAEMLAALREIGDRLSGGTE